VETVARRYVVFLERETRYAWLRDPDPSTGGDPSIFSGRWYEQSFIDTYNYVALRIQQCTNIILDADERILVIEYRICVLGSLTTETRQLI